MKRYKMLLCVLTMLLLLPTAAQAAGRVDTEAETSLTLNYHDGDTPLVGAWFGIYRVAEMDAYGALHAAPDFAGYPVDLSAENSEDDWRALSFTLEGYVLRDGLEATDSGTTDSRGRLTFPTDGKTLTAGLYLVIGERLEQDGMYYDASPFLVTLPTLVQGENEWSYDVSAAPKFTAEEVPEEDETVRRRVIKVWDDAGFEAERPEEIVVLLLCDGVVYDRVVLNGENNWRWQWDALEADHTWTLVEEAPAGYTVTVTQEGITFVVTNRRSGSDVPDEPDDTDIPDDSTPTGPKEPDTTDIPDDGVPGGPFLPQTGQLWWPVPVLLCVGAVLFALGLRRRGEE